MRKKLRDNRGETLVEVLASILIAALSVALLFSSIMASANIDRSARASDETYYEALSQAEGRTGDSEPLEITVKNGGVQTVLSVVRYAGKGAYSYAKEVGP